MRGMPYEIKQALKYLEDMGLKVGIISYRPGKQNLYQIVKYKNDTTIPLSPYFTRKELTIWAKGFISYPMIQDGAYPLI